MPGSNVRRNTNYPDRFLSVSSAPSGKFLKNTPLMPQPLLPNHYQFSIHHLIYHFLRNWLTSDSRVLETLPFFGYSWYSLNFMVPNIQCRVLNSPPLVHILNQANHHSTPTNSISLVLHSHLRLGLARCLFSSSFWTKTLCVFLPSPIREEHRKMTQK